MAKQKHKTNKFKLEIVDKFDEEDFFDDCPVCQTMKAAQKEGRSPTLPELKEAYQKAKDQGAIVGGEWFEKSTDSEKEKG